MILVNGKIITVDPDFTISEAVAIDKEKIAAVGTNAEIRKLADGKTIKEALMISAGEIIARLKGLPEDHLHCSILSVSTLYRAIADYLLKA